MSMSSKAKNHTRSKARAKPLPEYEMRNMAFMAHEFKERHGSLLSERARYQGRLALKAQKEAEVEQAKASVEAKEYPSPSKKAHSLTRRFRKIYARLKENREYALHVNDVTGRLYPPIQEPSFTNIVVRWTPIIGFNDAKSFKQNPKATVLHKSQNDMPKKWLETDPVTTPEYWVHTALLDGKLGAWKRDPAFIKEGSGVIYRAEAARATGGVGGGSLAANLVITGIFKEYSPEMIEANPDLIFCSPRFWIENGVLRDV